MDEVDPIPRSVPNGVATPIRELSDEAVREMITNLAADYYLDSGDFNGYPVRGLCTDDADRSRVRELLCGLIAAGDVTIEDGKYHPNPHIKALAPPPVEEQQEITRSSDLGHLCVYPTQKALATRVRDIDAIDRPFTRRLMLGEPQLEFHSFDVSVLEYYRNDPRYYYRNDDVRGSISVHDEFYAKGHMLEHDEVLLQTFGFGFDEDLNRGVVVFTRYLHGLSPEHQQFWNSKRHQHRFRMHPDYYRNSILGQWGEKVSVFDAFREEITQINAMAKLIGKPPLFRNEFKEKPRGFGFLVRPTTKEFNDFVLLLDQTMSDNLNKDFFKGDIELETDTPRADGKVVVTPKGTIQLLEQWFTKMMRFQDPQPFNRMVATFKKVRKLRQTPAHKTEDGTFNHGIFKEQRMLAFEAYGAVRTIRLLLANHPRTQSHQVPDWLYQANIWPF